VNEFESGNGALKLKFRVARSHALWSRSSVFIIDTEFFGNAAIVLD